MIEFVCGAVGFLACAAAFFAGMRYGARDRPLRQDQSPPDEKAVRKAEQEIRYRENFYSYDGTAQDDTTY